MVSETPSHSEWDLGKAHSSWLANYNQVGAFIGPGRLFSHSDQARSRNKIRLGKDEEGLLFSITLT